MCSSKKCNCLDRESKGDVRSLRLLVQELKIEVALLNARMDVCCSGVDPEPPEPGVISIRNFALNVTDVVGGMTLQINRATFSVNDNGLIKPNSLRIVYLNTNTTIVSGLSVSSPVSFSPIPLVVSEGGVYKWKAVIEDMDGNEYSSNEYQITCSAAPIQVKNTMIVGHTNISPTVFQGLSIDQIFALDDNRPREITGTSNFNFTINQEKAIHYLLIPSDKMDLIKSEFGTALITTLWDNANPSSGAYFTTNQGGVHEAVNYKVFFSYSPSGAFPEDIRVTCKNK